MWGCQLLAVDTWRATTAGCREAIPARWNVVMSLGFASLCALAPVALALDPRPGRPIAVVTLMPDAPLPTAVAATEARILWMSSQGRIVILDAATPDLIAALYRGGATLVVSAALFAGCSPRPGASTSPIGAGSL